jgi:hypothetical protein
MTRSASNLLSLGLAAAALVGVCSAKSANAQQDPEAIRRRFLLTIPTASSRRAGLTDLFRGAPGTNTGTPLAFGPGTGDFFVGGGYQNETRGVKRANGTFADNGNDDGSISAGFGLGDANDGIGLTTIITSLSTFRSGFGNRTAFSFQAFRHITPTMAVAVGVENAFISGGGKTDGTDSWYGVASKVFQSPSSDMEWLKAITVSAGIGNGRYRTVGDVSNGNKTVNVFGSVAALVHEQVSIIGDYTGQDINVGLSIVPFKKFPISVTPALADLTGTASKSPRLIVGVGIGMHF